MRRYAWIQVKKKLWQSQAAAANQDPARELSAIAHGSKAITNEGARNKHEEATVVTNVAMANASNDSLSSEEIADAFH